MQVLYSTASSQGVLIAVGYRYCPICGRLCRVVNAGGIHGYPDRDRLEVHDLVGDQVDSCDGKDVGNFGRMQGKMLPSE